ncbi:MAG TPA: phosphoribosylformylglycinamidine cyclo-ligase [Chloroflexia bacterium]
MGAAPANTYRQAGVDIDAGARTVGLMRAAVRGTFGPNVLADLGHFGGLYALDPSSENGPVLVASADGVGTKLKLAFALGTHRLIGHDIVNHCINDILACGARPLFFLDYVAAGKLVPEQTAEVVTGMAEACKAAGCALLGGETAEMPGMYASGEYDVAGFIVGMVARDRILRGHDIEPGDVVMALPSNGLHTNGYSLAREVLGLNGDPEQARERLSEYNETLGTTLGEALTRPHTSYLNNIAPLFDLPERPIKGLAHITGGGLLDNIPRVLPQDCAVELDTVAWSVPPIFRLIQKAGGIEPSEMARVFNMGLGMVLIVSPEHAELVESKLPNVIRAGRVVAWGGDERVSLRDEQ